jgi:hypothetical protein
LSNKRNRRFTERRVVWRRDRAENGAFRDSLNSCAIFGALAARFSQLA